MSEPVTFLSYTHGLRHPVIIGHVAGWRLPWALSVTQLGTVGAAAVSMLVSRPIWAHLGGIGNLVVFCVVVAAAGWATRYWRIEGRSPLRVAAGFTATILGPRRGVRNARPVRPSRPVCGHPVAIPITEGPDDE